MLDYGGIVDKISLFPSLLSIYFNIRAMPIHYLHGAHVKTTKE
jgi:hypothetical protein